MTHEHYRRQTDERRISDSKDPKVTYSRSSKTGDIEDWEEEERKRKNWSPKRWAGSVSVEGSVVPEMWLFQGLFTGYVTSALVARLYYTQRRTPKTQPRSGVFNLWSADPQGSAGSFQGVRGQAQKSEGHSHFN